MQFAGNTLLAAPAFGLDGARLLAQIGVSTSDLSNPNAYLTLEQVVTLARIYRRANRTGLPVALVMARCVRFSHLGMLGVAIVSADDLARAADIAARFGDRFVPGLELWLTRESDAIQLHMRLDKGLTEIADLVLEGSVFCGHQLAAHFDHPAQLRRVSFEHTTKFPVSVYEDFLGCPVEFGAEHTCIELVPHADRVQSLCRSPTTLEHATRQLREQPAVCTAETSWSGRVRAVWLGCAEKGEFLSREQLAKRLGLGPKTLARKLAAEGRGYRELMHDTRMQLALDLIRDSDLTPPQVGQRLGFQSDAAFYRAFRQWTSTTPSRVRRSLGHPPAFGHA